MPTDLKEHFDAGPLTDLPGHCKWCGGVIPDGTEFLMHDPGYERGNAAAGDPVAFCTAECLYKAERIFDGMTQSQLAQVEAAIEQVRSEDTTTRKH